MFSLYILIVFRHAKCTKKTQKSLAQKLIHCILIIFRLIKDNKLERLEDKFNPVFD